jgi:hypothetical protein
MGTSPRSLFAIVVARNAKAVRARMPAPVQTAERAAL